MLRAVGVWLLLVGCDSFALPFDDKPQPHPPHPPQPIEPAPPASGGGVTAPMPVLSLGGAPANEPEPEPKPEPCAVAAENGAIYCEPGEGSSPSLEYCVEAPPDGEPCLVLEDPPAWARELLLQCIAHCGVGIATSSRELEGACCYVATSQYYGR